jgi:hypothetical protein
MQIKMTLSFHLKPIGMAILENGNNKLWWWGYVEKEPLYTVGGNVSLVWALWKQCEGSSKNYKQNSHNDPVIVLLGTYLKECKSGYNKDSCTPMFTAVLFIIAKLWKQLRCPATDE